MKHPQGYGTDECPPHVRRKIAAAQSGEKAHHWAGDEVQYGGVHKRARAALPNECALADATCRGHLEVALKHDAVGPLREDVRGRGLYSPRVEDYWRLCRSHHNRYDGKQPPPETRTNRGTRAMARA